jgi:dipeptide/tripeptide permease
VDDHVVGPKLSLCVILCSSQEAMLGLVFAMFYFCINAGSLASTIVTPLLREYTTVRRHTNLARSLTSLPRGLVTPTPA